MKQAKILIGVILLFMVIGLAAVSTNIIINMTTPVNSNPDDFLVYFSDVKVDGTQDLSLVRNEKAIVFAAEFTAIGDKKTIDYDVTNASKNYDAAISISCTESTDYIKVTNSFDTSTDLAATSTRTGKLVVELSKSYTGQEFSQNISCTINANAVERTSLGTGTVSGPLERSYDVGTVVFIENEKFNIISSTDDTVTLLAQQGLDSSYRQSSTPDNVTFSETNGWEYTPGPKEVDIQQYDGNVKTYVNEYVSYLKSVTGDTTLSGDLITVNQLKSLGCTVAKDDYSPTTGDTCATSPYFEWLVNSQHWWTKSAWSTMSVWFTEYGSRTLWFVTEKEYNLGPGILYDANYWIYTTENGDESYTEGDYLKCYHTVRPVITISKTGLNK